MSRFFRSRIILDFLVNTRVGVLLPAHIKAPVGITPTLGVRPSPHSRCLTGYKESKGDDYRTRWIETQSTSVRTRSRSPEVSGDDSEHTPDVFVWAVLPWMCPSMSAASCIDLVITLPATRSSIAMRCWRGAFYIFGCCLDKWLNVMSQW